MKIKLFNWTIDFSGTHKWTDFWWTPNDQLIRKDCATFYGAEGNELLYLEREFYTFRSVLVTAATLPFWYIKRYLEKTTNDILAIQAARLTTVIALALISIHKNLSISSLIMGVITFDATSSGQSSSFNSNVSFAHSTSGSSRLLVGGTSHYDGNTLQGVTAITYNSLGLSNAVSAGFVGGNVGMSIDYYIAPATGSHTFAVTIGPRSDAAVVGGVISYTGADQSSPVDATASNNGSTGSSVGTTITPTSNNTMIVNVGSFNRGTTGFITVGGTQNEQWNLRKASSDTGGRGADAFNTTGGSGVTVNITSAQGNTSLSVGAAAFKSGISDLSINLSDSITITENVSIVRISLINVSDSISITESVTAQNTQLGGVNVSDVVSITENINITKILTLSVSDNLSITENITTAFINTINVSDSISITESVTAQNTQLGDISIQDSLTITENITAKNTQLGDINTSDSLTISESVSITNDLGNISVSDAISITESVDTARIDYPSGIAHMRSFGNTRIIVLDTRENYEMKSNQQNRPLGMDDKTML